MKKIIYDGFYNNILTFTLVQESKGDRIEKEYHFNLNLNGNTVLLGGVTIKCLHADNVGLTYQLVNISEH